MMFYLKIHKKDDTNIIAICDKELIGKTFEEGNKCLEVNKFYKGDLVDENEVKKYLNEDVLNLVGEKIIKLALEKGIITKDSIILFKGVPHVQVF